MTGDWDTKRRKGGRKKEKPSVVELGSVVRPVWKRSEQPKGKSKSDGDTKR